MVREIVRLLFGGSVGAVMVIIIAIVIVLAVASAFGTQVGHTLTSALAR